MDWLISDLFPRSLVDRLRSGEERFVVTGATGWFGSLTVGLLDEIYGADTTQRVDAFASRPRELRTRAGRRIPVRAIEDLPSVAVGDRPLHMLHFAFGVPARAAAPPTAGTSTATGGPGEIVAAAVSLLRPRGLCYPSSGAVYGQSRSERVLEYGQQKAADEANFRKVSASVGATIVIPRVFAVGGPCSPDPRRYLLGDLVLDALTGSSLRLRSNTRVYRSYISLADVLALSLTKLLSATGEELTFDACGEEVVEAAELADRVRRVLGRPELPILRDEAAAGHEGEDRYSGDPSVVRSMANGLGYQLAPLDEVIQQSALT